VVNRGRLVVITTVTDHPHSQYRSGFGSRIAKSIRIRILNTGFQLIIADPDPPGMLKEVKSPWPGLLLWSRYLVLMSVQKVAGRW